MSFIVSFNGQFRPYQVPNFNPYDRIHKSDTYNKVQGEVSHFDPSIPKGQGKKEHPNEPRNKNLKKYQENIHSHNKNTLPHHAKDIMSTKIVYITSNLTIADAVEKLTHNNIHHLPILNHENVLIGIVSDRDLHHSKTEIISKHMTSKVITCLDTTRIQDIAKIMLHENISALPVINHLHELKGIITKTDLLYFLTRIIHLDDLI